MSSASDDGFWSDNQRLRSLTADDFLHLHKDISPLMGITRHMNENEQSDQLLRHVAHRDGDDKTLFDKRILNQISLEVQKHANLKKNVFFCLIQFFSLLSSG